MKFLKEKVREVKSINRCGNLTRNYLTPLLCAAQKACDRTRGPTKATLLIEKAAKASGGCPSSASLILLPWVCRVLLGAY